MTLSLLVSAVLISFLLFLRRKKVSFGIRVMTAMFLGVAVGAALGKEAEVVGILGDAFVNLIKMLVIPLVVTAILSSITTIKDPAQLRKIGLKTIGLFLLTAVIASSIGILVGNAFHVGAGMDFNVKDPGEAREIPPVTEVLLNMVPDNPVAEAAEGQILPVIFFAMLIGIAITIESRRNPESVEPVKRLIESFSKVMFRVTKMILKLTPYGVYGLMVRVAAEHGLSTLLPLMEVVVAVYLACLIHLVITYGSLVSFVAKVNPVRFLKKIWPVMVVAFSTRSSYGTLPVTLKTLTNRVKVSEKISSFVAPLGATMNMDACGGLYPAVVAVFVANVFNLDLGATDYLLLVTTAALASIGTAGVPGTASIMTTVVLTSMGLPLEGMAMVLGIDALLDMGRTAVNVTGDTVASLVIADSEGEFDRDSFNSDEAADELELNEAV
ncbi:Na+/H+-dicarboxylate symporter [Melghirimyces profundicolus]|uniref:Na+/H+-dicarboxylate symporter n=1 Tax=Melghirimyces profundicolus TaxID=1242148 RepID=A0A2T6C0D3_9BACL|nr:dicarboxylate/amino acid:cation symporter [Melghirimyces profundicolus]PTX61776.1 Na+/H+-dicarboxylate symporter [Melghirimyces profundicolus]